MSSERSQLLKSILSLSSNITTQSSQPNQTQLVTSSPDHPQLALPSFDATVLEDELKKRPLTSNIIDALVSIVQEHARRAAKSKMEKYEEVLSKIQSTSPSVAFYQHLVSSFQTFYQQDVDQIKKVLLEQIDSKVAAFQADAEASSSEEESNTNGGHSKTAIAILEYAYSECQNISPAEKNGLAKLTGLQPRQVTIWYQNRRNRKVKNPKQPCAPSLPLRRSRSPTSSPGPQNGGSNRKRKNASVNGNSNEPSHPSERSYDKRQRTDGAQDEDDEGYRIVSGDASCSSSVVSSLDSFGKPGKYRTASGSSVATSVDDSPSCSPTEGFSHQDMSQFLLGQQRQSNPTPNFIFTDNGPQSVAQLDFDDLRLDPNDLSTGLGFDFSMPEASGLWNPVNMGIGMFPTASVALSPPTQVDDLPHFGTESQVTPRQETFNSIQMPPPSLPLRRSSQVVPSQVPQTTMHQMANELSDADFEATLREIISSTKTSTPSMESSFETSNGQESHFNFSFDGLDSSFDPDHLANGLSEGFVASSSSSSSSSSVHTPELDPIYEFDFSMDGLGITQAWEHAEDSLYQVEESARKQTQLSAPFIFGKNQVRGRRDSGEMDVDVDIVEQDARLRDIAVSCA